MNENMKDWNEYQQLAVRTAKDYDDPRLGLAYFSLGLVGEATELLAAMRKPRVDVEEIIKESGDVLWYTAKVAHLCNVELESVADHANTIAATPAHSPAEVGADVAVTAGVVGETLKKVVRDDRRIDPDALALKLANVMVALRDVASVYGLALSYVAQRNIEKLMARYPKGHFDAADAIKRADGESLNE